MWNQLDKVTLVELDADGLRGVVHN